MQMFCGVLIDPSHPLKDGKIVSVIRNRLARVLDIREMQRVQLDHWKSELHHLDRCHLLRKPPPLPDRHQAAVGMLRMVPPAHGENMQVIEGTAAPQQIP